MTKQLRKNVILYFEDEDNFRETAERELKKNLPLHQIIVHDGGRRHGSAKSCIDEVLAQIDSLNNVAIVCTDGNLAGFVTGWDVVEELNHKGYNGPAIYTGGSPLPKEKSNLYENQTSKFGDDLISAIRQYLTSQIKE